MQVADAARPRVSVVVPVYDPGPHIEPCIASLLAQTLPAQEWEAVFVDDGSTDGTGARLDELAAAHANVRVVHQENSGWSGQPRNVGVDASRGAYVQFLDQDDWLGTEALERLCATAERTGADVVVGKMAGVGGRSVPRQLFRRTVDRATLADTPLIDSLTPHKMFRRAFLDEHGLRFPEGRRRLEDHVFVVSAYLHATTVSVLSDYVCYYHSARSDGGNAGFRPLEPVAYFRDLRDALDAVEALTEPGILRDKLHRRWLRVEMLRRLRGRQLLAADEDYRRELLHEVSVVTQERFGPGVDAGLPPVERHLAALARREDLDGLLAFAHWEQGLGAAATLTELRWEGPGLRLAVEAALVDGTGAGLATEDGRLEVSEPAGAAGEGSAGGAGAVSLTTSEAKPVLVDLLLVGRDSGEQHYLLTTSTTPQGRHAPVGGRVEVLLDPLTAATGAPLTRGIYDVSVQVRAYGWAKTVRVGSTRAAGLDRAPRPGLVGTPSSLVTPYWTDKGNLSVDVKESTRKAGPLLSASVAHSTAVRGAGTVSVSLRIPFGATVAAEVPVRLVGVGAPTVTTTGTLRAVSGADGQADLAFAAPADALSPRNWVVDARLAQDPDSRWTPIGATIVVPADGVVGLMTLRRPGGPSAQAPSRSRLSVLAREGVARLPVAARGPVSRLVHRATTSLR